ncbi:MAG: hypothetical protein EI684_18360 [Candidatus Viridilinea halotolerans]|uniref:Transposase n=1 Tax=Candidatus Viridilinea halotolerans TaxID=2491704 RepID=A0A426TTE7_9CHLR|nr:MAG: hypothetical protein EI684_18360 [Candidatus Viridilinea halotolerans]
MTTQAPANPAQDSPEVTSRPAKQWTPVQRLAILAEYEALPKGDARRGALLRRHGIYSSHIARWRIQRGRGVLENEAIPTAGRPPQICDPRQQELARLSQEAARLQSELQQAEAILSIQRSLLAACHPDADHAERRTLMLASVHELAPLIGVVAACAALGVPRSSFYYARRHAPPPCSGAPAATPAPEPEP